MITIDLFYSRFTRMFIICVINGYSSLIKFNSVYGLSMTGLSIPGCSFMGKLCSRPGVSLPNISAWDWLRFFNFFIGLVIGFRSVTFLWIGYWRLDLYGRFHLTVEKPRCKQSSSTRAQLIALLVKNNNNNNNNNNNDDDKNKIIVGRATGYGKQCE